MSPRLTTTQRAALEFAASHGCLARSRYGSQSSLYGPKGLRVATLRKLHTLGLLTWDMRMGHESIPAGPFGRTRDHGYMSIMTSELVCKLTDAGKAVLSL